MIKTELEYHSIQELLDEKIILEMQDGNHGERHPRQSDFVTEGISFLTATNVVDEQVLIHLAPRVSYQKAKTLRIGWIQPDDVLLAHNATVGRVGIVPKFEGKAVIGTSLTYYRLNQQKLNSNFFALVLRSQDFQAQLEQAMEQTTRNQVPITRQKELLVPLPPIEEQKRIATIAQKADRLRRTRRYTLELSDSYLRSVFLQMFGDLVSNSLGWKFEKLGNIAEIASGVTKGQKFNGKTTITVPYLRVANVQDGFLDLSEIKMIEALPSDVEALKLLPGDVLMTEGGDYDKLGRGAIWRGEIKTCIHQNHIFRVRTNQRKVLPIFFASLLVTKFAKDYFLRCSKQTTNLATINMTQLKELPVPLIPLPLQEKFAQIVQRFERLRIQQREAERQAEHLFQTILHRAFRGEL